MVTGAYFPEVSGASLQCRELLRALGDRVDAAVLTTSRLASNVPVEIDGVPVSRVPVRIGRRLSELAAAAALARGLLRLARRRSIVHFHGFSRKSLFLIPLARRLGKHTIVKLTSVGDDDPPSIRRQGRLHAWVHGSADLYIAVSPRQVELCVEAGIAAARVRLIPNGVDLARFRPSADEERATLRRALALPDAPVVLCVGHFSHDKQPQVLFDAWRRLGPPAGTLVFVGATRAHYEVDPALADRVRAAAAPFGRRVVFVERADEIEAYYRVADVFALPSRREGLPNALLEAMASGHACVASLLPGVTDTLIHDGVDGTLVPPGDVSALAQALDEVIADSATRRRLGEAARAHVAAHYDLRATAAAHLDLYEGFTAPSHRRR